MSFPWQDKETLVEVLPCSAEEDEEAKWFRQAELRASYTAGVRLFTKRISLISYGSIIIRLFSPSSIAVLLRPLS